MSILHSVSKCVAAAVRDERLADTAECPGSYDHHRNRYHDDHDSNDDDDDNYHGNDDDHGDKDEHGNDDDNSNDGSFSMMVIMEMIMMVMSVLVLLTSGKSRTISVTALTIRSEHGMKESN